MVSTYFLDESGNTGDLATATDLRGFGGQPVFALACLGVDDEAALGAELARLKQHHNIQVTGELKSKHLAAKPRFVGDLVAYLRRESLPVMIEVMEKRFTLCIHLVDRIIAPAVIGAGYTRQYQTMKNLIAEYLWSFVPDAPLQAYIAACNAPSPATIQATFDAFREWLGEGPPRDQCADALRKLLSATEDQLKEIGLDTAEAHERFLPLPDLDPKGAPVWMLPHLSSFAHIYGRLNLLHRRQVGCLTLVHDDQRQFECVLRDGKVAAEGIQKLTNVPMLPFASFAFDEQAAFEFRVSDTSPGIQAADILAGFVMRLVKQTVIGKTAPHPDARTTFLNLLSLTHAERGLGINLVVSQRVFDRLGIRQA